VIQIRQHVVPQSRTSTGSLWEASAEIGGKTYSAASRHGAPQALARALVAAGIPDQPVIVCSEVCVFDNGAEIRTEQVRGGVTYRSLHAMAKTTFEEGNRPLHRARFKERPETAFALQPGEQETRFTPPDDVVVQEGHDPSKVGHRKCVSCGRDFLPARPWSIFCSPACRLRAHRRARRDESQEIMAVSEPVP
jgi:ferredoxin